MYRVFFKKFFGAKYEMIFVAILTCFFMYIISKNVFYDISFDMYLLANTILSVILSYQTITSNDNNESFKRLFTYPLNPNEFKIKYIISVLIYSISTRSLILFIVYCNVSGFNIKNFVVFLVNTITITLLMIAIFLLKHDNKKLSYILSTIEIFFYMTFENINLLLISYFINLVISIFIIAKSDVFLFRYEKNIKNKKISTKHTTFLMYVVRYFTFNKSYILSWISVFIIIFGVANIDISLDINRYVLYLFVMLIYNTPLSIVISSNKSLQDKIKSFPNKIIMFYVPYFLIIFLLNLFITSLFIFINNIDLNNIYKLMHLLICIQHSLIVVFLEYKFPVKKWNTETELWNNPRKYIPISFLLTQVSFFYHFF